MLHGPGHAICLVYSDTVPSGFGYYSLKDYYTPEGEHLKDGDYIPIDYEYVGATSNAMEDSWILRKMYVPENIYGERM